MNKEKLLKEKENILKNIEKRKGRIAQIERELKELENKRWKPKYDDTYFHIYGDGEIDRDVNTESEYDKDLLSMGNYFKTREEAEFEVERLKVLEELKEFSYEFSDEEWKDETFLKYNISYSYSNSTININGNLGCKNDLIYFKTRIYAQKAIDKIGEERLKKYYFKVGNK